MKICLTNLNYNIDKVSNTSYRVMDYLKLKGVEWSQVHLGASFSRGDLLLLKNWLSLVDSEQF
ncbi:CLUMA_CG006163, isoform A [Clunio marinus]|uniref:CLUMA_CG006163, isoform A n=1 Tax=Clunio marinus TaxID=568069 RepID=A0A1J1HYH4_9DIPT|nr:CLUMA_CG006163, isoform A [Clunio marinus]